MLCHRFSDLVNIKLYINVLYEICRMLLTYTTSIVNIFYWKRRWQCSEKVIKQGSEKSTGFYFLAITWATHILDSTGHVRRKKRVSSKQLIDLHKNIILTTISSKKWSLLAQLIKQRRGNISYNCCVRPNQPIKKYLKHLTKWRLSSLLMNN